jgi:ABC-type transport system substrate-binding protein
MKRYRFAVAILPFVLALLWTWTATVLLSSAASGAMPAKGNWRSPESEPGYQATLSTPTLICTYYFGFNTAKAPFNQALVRKAFIAALDRTQLPSILDGPVLPAMTFTPPGIFGHVDGFTEGVGIPYNPTQARQWLAAAGYPNGQDLPAIDVVGGGLTGQITTSYSLQFAYDGWSENLDVKVNLVFMEASAFLDLLEEDPPQVWYLRWCTDQPGQHDAYYYLHDGINSLRVALGNWQNTTYDDLLSQALATPDLAARKLLYKQAEEILVETDAVILPMHYSGVAGGYRVFLPVVLKNR